jgi:aquaporin Z
MLDVLRRHHAEYLIEAAALAAFMLSACVFGTLLWHPDFATSRLAADGIPRRALMGLAMGLTAIGMGKQSGAHMNPSVTLAFLRLGRVRPWDALFYVCAQFAGGLAGVLLSGVLLGRRLAHPSVHYVVTIPGSAGTGVAFAAEALISFVLMLTVLVVSSSTWQTRTGLFAGLLVATWITFEAPLSGMSMNPARTVGSALPAMTWTALWVYLVAPPLGMLAAAEAFTRAGWSRSAGCAKLHHANRKRCIFCGDAQPARPQGAVA